MLIAYVCAKIKSLEFVYYSMFIDSFCLKTLYTARYCCRLVKNLRGKKMSQILSLLFCVRKTKKVKLKWKWTVSPPKYMRYINFKIVVPLELFLFVTIFSRWMILYILQTAEELLTLAFESGINFFDTAEVYAAGK